MKCSCSSKSMTECVAVLSLKHWCTAWGHRNVAIRVGGFFSEDEYACLIPLRLGRVVIVSTVAGTTVGMQLGKSFNWATRVLPTLLPQAQETFTGRKLH